jgi:hypothetical protein
VAQEEARGVRGAEAAGSSPANPTIEGARGALAQWESTGLSIRVSRVRVPHASPSVYGLCPGGQAFYPGGVRDNTGACEAPEVSSSLAPGTDMQRRPRRSSVDPEHCPPKAGAVRSNRTGETGWNRPPTIRKVPSMGTRGFEGHRHGQPWEFDSSTFHPRRESRRHRIAVVRRILNPEAGGRHPVAVRSAG